jgi:hypothetical protein
MIEIKPIPFEPAQPAATAELRQLFETAAPAIVSAHATRGPNVPGPSAPPELVDAVREFLDGCEKLDAEYGETGPLPLEDVDEFADTLLRYLAELRNWLPRLGLADREAVLDRILIGAALWAVRHDVDLMPLDALVNALAHAANNATSKQELAAVFGLMQGVIGAVAEVVKADLDKSDPYRPWRILLLNFAIVAVRSQDIPMMRHAFAALERHLPEECPGFFAEGVARAKHPAFADEVRDLLNAEHVKWTVRH